MTRVGKYSIQESGVDMGLVCDRSSGSGSDDTIPQIASATNCDVEAVAVAYELLKGIIKRMNA